jgi:hypothetical protein
MRYILSVIILMSFLLLPANHRLMIVNDDDDYFAVASSIAYGNFPYFSDEYHVGKKMPFASVGPGVLAAPFVAVFSIFDRALHAPIVKKRDKDNRYWTWSLLGFHVAVYFYFLLGVFFLNEALKFWGTEDAAIFSTLLILLGGGGVLIYVFKRPVMSHAFEFFTVNAAVLLITLAVQKRVVKHHDEIIGSCAAFLFLTRYNNLFVSLGLNGLYLYVKWKNEGQILVGRVARIFLPFCLFIAVFRFLPIVANGYSSYDQGYAGVLGRIIPEVDPLFYWYRIGDIFLGRDMGLVYTAPVLVVALIASWLYRSKLPKELLFLGGFCLFNFYFAIVWKSFGSYYGYRYLTYTALPLLAVPLVLLVDDLLRAIGRWRVLLLGVVLCYFPVMSTLAFNNSDKFQLARIANSWGVVTYTVPGFHADLLTDLLNNPVNPVMRAWQTGFGSFFWRELSVQQTMQRASLYIGPPFLFLLLYWFIRTKSRIMKRSVKT